MRKLKGRAIRKIASKMVSQYALENLLSIMEEPPVHIPRELKQAEQQLHYVTSRTGIAAVQVELGLHWQENLNGYYLAASKQGMIALIPYGLGGYVFYDEGKQQFQRVDRRNEGQFREKVWEITPSLPHGSPIRSIWDVLKRSRSEVKWMAAMFVILLCCAWLIPLFCKEALWNVVPSGKQFAAYSVELGLVLLSGGMAVYQFVELLHRVCEKADLRYSAAAMGCFSQRKPMQGRQAAAVCKAICSNPCGTSMRFLILTVLAVGLSGLALFCTEYPVSVCKWMALSVVILGIQGLMLWKTIPHQMMDTLSLYTEGQAWLRQMEREKDLPERDPIIPSGKHRTNSAFGYTTAVAVLLAAVICMQGAQNQLSPAHLLEYGAQLAPVLFLVMLLMKQLPDFMAVLYWDKTVLRGMSFKQEYDHRTAMLSCDGALRFDRVSAANFSELSIQIQSGDKLGIYGAAGCGKTAFLKIAAGLLPIRFGAVYSSGCDCAQVQGESWRQFIKWIPKANPTKLEQAMLENASILLLDQVCDTETVKMALHAPQTCIMTATRKKWLTGCNYMFRLENGVLIPEGR